MRPDLLIGIGNPLRGDDGVGALLVEELARQGSVSCPPGAEFKAVHQLTPELAVAVAAAGRVLFVDAWANPDRAEPWIESLLPRQRDGEEPENGGPGGHGWGPLALVSLAELLYGWQGQAALLRVPAFSFPHGSAFSAPLEQALPMARHLLHRWLKGG
ncbi:MAG: hydrogenase maturation protease [Cyanobacteriota bacterium]